METKQITYIHFFIATILFATVSTVISDDGTPIPANAGQINGWFQANVKPAASRKGSLDPSLEAAEAAPKRIKVSKDGSGEFKTITAALASIPAGNANRVIVDIGPGVYEEKITVDSSKHFVTLLGSSSAPTLQFAGTAKKYGTVYSATLTVEGNYFVAKNLIIKNNAPRPDGVTEGAQAVSLKVAGDMAAFYNCKVYGFQDTVLDDKGRHFFKDCYIEGTVDFIFGSGKSIYLSTTLNVLKDKYETVITAQAKHSKSDVSGFSFVHCTIKGDATGTLLGRAWMEMPEVIFSFTEMSGVVAPAGWSNYNHPEREPNIVFAEYENKGAGAATASRVKFSKKLTAGEATRFISLGYIQGSKWLLPPP